MSHKYTQRYKKIRLALALTKHEVHEIMELGGQLQSLSEIEGWQRRETDERRYRPMNKRQFDAFLDGLTRFAEKKKAEEKNHFGHYAEVITK